jgi:hypothetical protein
MSEFEYSLGRLRAAVERFMEGSPDDFGRHMCNDLLEPMLNEIQSLSYLSETTAQGERDCLNSIDDADAQHNR